MTLRRDAARNWHQILDTGRRLVDEGGSLRLNDVARAASVGVATVYRHFPTTEALLEAVARPSLEALAAHAEQALADDDAWGALTGYLAAGIDAQLADASVQPVFAAASQARPETTELVGRLHAAAGRLLRRAQAAGAVRTDLDQADLTRLMCGVVLAGTVHATTDERAVLTRRYLDVTVNGLRPSS